MWNWLKDKSRWPRNIVKRSQTSVAFFPEIQTYVERELQKQLGLFNIIPLAGHYQNAIAQTKEGKVFINFFPSHRSMFSHCHLFTHSLLQKYEIDVPPLVWADTDPQNLQKYHVCCVVSQRIPGKPLRTTSKETALEAFKILGKIHSISYDHLKNIQPHQMADNPLPILSFQNLRKDPKPLFESPITKEFATVQDISRVFSFVESRLKTFSFSLNFPVLLHLDFHPGNIMLSTNNTLVLVDLETSAFGPFFIDLNKALIRFCYKSRSHALDDIDIDELMHSSTMQKFSQMYFTHAPSNTRKVWDSSGSFFLFCAYLQIIQKLALKASYPCVHIEQTTAQLKKRWKSILRYLKRYEKTFTSLVPMCLSVFLS